MDRRQARLAAEVLRQHAPAKSHEVRRACFAVVEYLDGDLPCPASAAIPRPVTDPRIGEREMTSCELLLGHAGPHEARLLAGGTLTWPDEL